MSDVHEDHDEHDEHVDERWLVSYADMMTLLFGLFVLLYSLSVMDKNAAEKAIQSTKEKFGESQTETPEPVKVEPAKIDTQAIIQNLQIEKLELETKMRLQEEKLAQVDQWQKELDAKKTELRENKEELQRNKKELDNLLSTNKSLQMKSQDIEKSNRKIRELEQKLTLDPSKKLIAQLEAQLLEQKSFQTKDQILKEKIEKISFENTKLKQTLEQNQRDLSSVDKNEEKINNLESQLQQLESSKEDLEKNNKLLEASLKKAESAGGAHKAFLAVFISWSTRDHDIDLVVKDPSGKKFDFKNRKHGSHPGYFALDTRRGPGAELWQSDRIVPGTYTATYSFYNQYGNTDPAKVSGTIYSAKGSFEITTVQMDVGSKKEYLIQFDVKEDGSVNVLNMKH